MRSDVARVSGKESPAFRHGENVNLKDAGRGIQTTNLDSARDRLAEWLDTGKRYPGVAKDISYLRQVAKKKSKRSPRLTR